jgi:hypothetical protein
MGVGGLEVFGFIRTVHAATWPDAVGPRQIAEGDRSYCIIGQLTRSNWAHGVNAIWSKRIQEQIQENISIYPTRLATG